MAWVRPLTLGAVLTSLTATARGEELTAAPTYALSWVRAEGAEECPPGRVLIAEVERRLGRAVFDAGAARTFEVEVTRFGARYRSDVFVRDVDGRALGHRNLQSDEPGCEALLNATALAIALVIDPEAAAREPAPTASTGAFEPPPTPPAAPLPAPPPAPPPAPSPGVLTPSRPPPIERPYDAIEMAVRAELSAGLLPSPSPGLQLEFRAQPRGGWGFALGGAYAAPQISTRGIGSVEVGLTRASVLATWEAARSDRFRLLLAAGPTVGAFHVAVRSPAPVTAPGDYWFGAAQLALGLQLLMTKALFAEAGASGFVPFRRQQFLVRGQAEPVWSQSWVSSAFFFGVGATFL